MQIIEYNNNVNWNNNNENTAAEIWGINLSWRNGNWGGKKMTE